MNELEALKSKGEDSAILDDINQQDRQIAQLEADNRRLREEREVLEGELEKIREANAQIEETIAQLEREGGKDGLE